MQTTVQLVHRAILEDAARIANDALLGDPDLSSKMPDREGTREVRGRFNAGTRKRRYFVAGQFFRPDMNRSKKGGLCLSLDESVQHMDPDTIAKLHEIGVRAVKQALTKNQDKFVGLILGDARSGNNYFDRFREEGEQLELL